MRRRRGVDEQLAVLVDANDRRHRELRSADQRAIDKYERATLEALGVARTEASDRLLAHNGLIDKMEAQSATFATREMADRRFGRLEQWQARITGGLVLVSAIGVGNLIKIWFT